MSSITLPAGNDKRDFYIPASQGAATDEARTLQLARHV